MNVGFDPSFQPSCRLVSPNSSAPSPPTSLASSVLAHQRLLSSFNCSRRTTPTLPLIRTLRPHLEAAASAKSMAIRDGVDGTGTKTLALVVRERIRAAAKVAVELFVAGEFGIEDPLVESR